MHHVSLNWFSFGQCTSSKTRWLWDGIFEIGIDFSRWKIFMFLAFLTASERDFKLTIFFFTLGSKLLKLFCKKPWIFEFYYYLFVNFSKWTISLILRAWSLPIFRTDLFWINGDANEYWSYILRLLELHLFHRVWQLRHWFYC